MAGPLVCHLSFILHENDLSGLIGKSTRNNHCSNRSEEFANYLMYGVVPIVLERPRRYESPQRKKLCFKKSARSRAAGQQLKE